MDLSHLSFKYIIGVMFNLGVIKTEGQSHLVLISCKKYL